MCTSEFVILHRFSVSKTFPVPGLRTILQLTLLDIKPRCDILEEVHEHKFSVRINGTFLIVIRIHDIVYMFKQSLLLVAENLINDLNI